MPVTRYMVPAAAHRVEEEIQHSRFITTIGPAPTVEAARTLVTAVSTEFADASHNCWAYVVGAPGDTSRIGLSDAGEPHGTAGRPMLNILLHSGLGDVTAVVTRYFGGTLLGTGGLVRAYGGGVQLALQTLSTVERVPRAEVTVVIDYATVTPFQRLLRTYEAEVLEQEFAVDATYRVQLPQEQISHFTTRLVEMTNGGALVEVTRRED
jgi:uncharacterized YigZ family protein